MSFRSLIKLNYVAEYGENRSNEFEISFSLGQRFCYLIAAAINK